MCFISFIFFIIFFIPLDTHPSDTFPRNLSSPIVLFIFILFFINFLIKIYFQRNVSEKCVSYLLFFS
jgi:hypothetical protein